MKLIVCVKQVPDTTDIKWTENNTIQREGVNDFGKRVRFYFNYSGEKQTAICKGFSGTELLSGRKIMEQETLPLEPWGVVIVEEN